MNYRSRRRWRRFRRRARLTRNQQFAAAAIGAGLLLAVTHHPKVPAAAAPATATRTVTPSGSSYTPASWAAALLPAAGLPATRCNFTAIGAWENAEGGNWANAARFNPLDTTQPEPGSQPMNSVNVQAYPSWQAGFAATVTTLHNGNYPAILAALQAGSSAQAVAGAVAASPWGTGPFTATC